MNEKKITLYLLGEVQSDLDDMKCVLNAPNVKLDQIKELIYSIQDKIELIVKD